MVGHHGLGSLDACSPPPHNRGVPTTETTWGEAAAAVTARLAAAGIEEAAVEAALLLAHVVGANRTLVQLYRERRLTAAQAAELAALTRRRVTRLPLAYVLGHQEFLGLDFAVDPRALVPRWDTEALVERAVELLGGQPEPWAADIGTGSGAIAVSLAVRLPAARVWASDRSAEAIELAADNGRRLGVGARLTWLQGDLAQPLLDLGLAGRLAALLANLPYIPSAQIAELAPEVRDFEPRRALDGGPDGLDLVRRLAPQAAELLAPGGFALFECGDGQTDPVAAILEGVGLCGDEVVADWGGRPRGVLRYKPS